MSPLDRRATRPLRVEAVESTRGEIAGWARFIVFVLGPCEPLIPILACGVAIKFLGL